MIRKQHIGQRLLLKKIEVLVILHELLFHQLEAKVDLLLFNIIINRRALVHVMHGQHQLYIGQQL